MPLTRITLFFTLLLSATAWADKPQVQPKTDVLAVVENHEALHLLYRDNKALHISAEPENGQMTLKVNKTAKPKQVTVHKPGERALSFSVPIKSEITTPPSIYPKPEKLFAISDVEGNFNTVTGMLKQQKVIDAQLHWQYGKGHLVFIGDVFDRGNHVTELLWLIYRLEGEARAAGGEVHMLLGNHEIMVLQNDLRYAEKKYVTFDGLLQKQQGLRYVDLLREDSELGRWLRSKNIVEKIGDTLFTHGGMSPMVAEQKLSLDHINKAMRAAIDVAKADRNAEQKLLFGRGGPIWYRGYFMPIRDTAKITEQELDKVLTFYQAKAVAVGHTIVEKPQPLFDGKVIAVDVKHPADHLTVVPPRLSWAVEFSAGKMQVVSFKP